MASDKCLLRAVGSGKSRSAGPPFRATQSRTVKSGSTAVSFLRAVLGEGSCVPVPVPVRIREITDEMRYLQEQKNEALRMKLRKEVEGSGALTIGAH